MRRNRIKAVINVPARGGRKVPPDRPPTPIISPSSLSNSSSHSQDPPSPAFIGRSPSPAFQLSLVGSPSPKATTRYISLPSPGGIFSPRSPEDVESYAQIQAQMAANRAAAAAAQNSGQTNKFHHHEHSGGRSSPGLVTPKGRYMSFLGLVPSPTPRGEETFFPKSQEELESFYVAQNSKAATTPTAVAVPTAPTSPQKDFGKDSVLRKRLEKPSPSLTTTKYQTLRKEFLNKAADTKEKEGGAQEKKELTMLHFAFFNPPAPKKEDGATTKLKADSGLASTSKSPATPTPPAEIAPKEPPAPPASGGPRVKVGPDGRLIIDEQSLLVETSESQRAKKHLSEMETVSGADYAVGSSGLFRNKKHGRRGGDWTPRETVKFYRALSLCGTDFSMMTTLFPCRTRRELKSKFKREDRKNSNQISSALSCQEFDPKEGITDSEPEEETSDKDKPEEDFVLGGDGKPKKKKTFKRRRNRPLTEIERRLQEELEEVAIMFSKDSDPKPIPNLVPMRPNAENVLRKKSKGGRPTASWKSNVIVDDVTGKPMAACRKKIKADPGEEVALKKPRPPKKKVELPPGINQLRSPVSRKKRKKSKIDDDDDDDTVSVCSRHSTSSSVIQVGDESGSHSMQAIPLLRFDQSDPLGLKVGCEIPGTRSRSNSSNSNSLDKVPGMRTRSNSSLDTAPPINEESPVPDVGVKKRKKSGQSKVKGFPFRVPGPGGLSSPPAIVDEIEIEISCQ